MRYVAIPQPAVTGPHARDPNIWPRCSPADTRLGKTRVVAYKLCLLVPTLEGKVATGAFTRFAEGELVFLNFDIRGFTLAGFYRINSSHLILHERETQAARSRRRLVGWNDVQLTH